MVLRVVCFARGDAARSEDFKAVAARAENIGRRAIPGYTRKAIREFLKFASRFRSPIVELAPMRALLTGRLKGTQLI